ncbi:MAG: NfeD family protein, partial [Actinomycetota bacterium]|nr:NfeD family protein [Actinomycetota bacterium]
NTRPLGLILIVLSVLAFGIDVQAGIPRFWTGVGVLGVIFGSFTLYDGHSMSWITLLVGVVLTIIFMISGMPSLVRTRFSTTTIGREWMIGEMGEVVTEVAPDGTVRVRDALWRARANRLTPLSVGDRARVVAIEGTVLEVEPEEGGARDYREMRG